MGKRAIRVLFKANRQASYIAKKIGSVLFARNLIRMLAWGWDAHPTGETEYNVQPTP